MALSSEVVGWAVMGIVITALAGGGFAVMSTNPPEFQFARACFAGAAILLALKTGWWVLGSNAEARDRVVVTVLAFSLSGIGWTESWRWVNGREHQYRESLKPPARSTTSREELPPKRPETEKAPAEKSPLATSVSIVRRWIKGAEPVIEVENCSNGRIEVLATCQILKASVGHKRHDSFPAQWRSDAPVWVSFERGDKKKIVLARHSYVYGGDAFVTVPERLGEAEQWNDRQFRYADLFYEFETKPPLPERPHDSYRLTWNGRQKIFELGTPMEEGDD